jgi:hypothetical protein
MRKEGRKEGREGGREGTYHLCDLGEGDEPGGEPVGDLLDDGQPVVGVHDGVHGVVHGDEDDAGVLIRIGEPGEEEDRYVVVPVETKEGGRKGGNKKFVSSSHVSSLLLLFILISFPPHLLSPRISAIEADRSALHTTDTVCRT